jgi:hypothetical protein
MENTKMEVNPFSLSWNKTTTSSATDESGFVHHEVEAMVIVLCVISVILVFVIIFLVFKLCSCGEVLSSSRSSSQNSLYSNSSSDSPYQWRSLSIGKNNKLLGA